MQRAAKLLATILSLSSTSAHAVIFFSEAYPNPCGLEGVNGTSGGNPVEGLEWFEITNPDATVADLSGFTIADATSSSGNRFRIDNLSIAAGSTVVFSGLPLTTFNSTFGTALTALQYYEIPATPSWTSNGAASGMNNNGWLNNTSGDVLRIFTDGAGTVELAGAYRPGVNFPTTSDGQSFYWDGISSNWTLNSTAASPAGFEANNINCPHYSSPGIQGAAIPEAKCLPTLFGGILALGYGRRRHELTGRHCQPKRWNYSTT